MSVAEIKEYIDEQEKYARQQIENHEIKMDLKDHINILDNVSSMLDGLELETYKNKIIEVLARNNFESKLENNSETVRVLCDFANGKEVTTELLQMHLWIACERLKAYEDLLKGVAE